jgi:hypothetical protein
MEKKVGRFAKGKKVTIALEKKRNSHGRDGLQIPDVEGFFF